MSDHSEPQSPNSFKQRSFEEIFGLGPNSQAAESQPPRSLEEIFGIESGPISPKYEDTDWSDFGEPQPQSVESGELERVSLSEVHQSTLELPELDLSDLIRQDQNLKDDEEMGGSGHVPVLSKDHFQGSGDPVNPPVMMDLNLNLDEPDAIPSSLAAVPVGESQLFEQASQGDEAAIRNLLDRELVDYGAAVVELEMRGSLLQISVASDEVPSQEVITPLVQAAIASLNLIKPQKVSLYGQRHGSELPFWRSEFDPSDPSLGMESPEDELTLDEVPPSEPFRLERADEFIQPELSHSELSQIDLEHYGLESPGSDQVPDELPVVAETKLTETESTETEFASIPSSPITDEGSGRLELLVQDDFTDSWLKPLETEAPESRMIEPITAAAGLDSSASEPTPVDVTISLEKREAVRDFLERYADGERNFAHIDLSETDLSGINLTLADLHKGSFVWANLKDASLYHVNLSEAKLRHANLNGAKLRSANLQAADFLNADLKGADLSWSDLRGANLTGADLSDANLKNAILERVTMPDGTLLD